MAQREQDRQAAAGRAAADDRRQRVELDQKLVEIVRPDFVFGFLAVDDDIGGAAVAPVEDDDAIAKIGQRLCLRLDAADVASAAGRQRHPRTAIAENFVVDVDTAYLCDWHRFPPLAGAAPGSDFEIALPHYGCAPQSHCVTRRATAFSD